MLSGCSGFGFGSVDTERVAKCHKLVLKATNECSPLFCHSRCVYVEVTTGLTTQTIAFGACLPTFLYGKGSYNFYFLSAMPFNFTFLRRNRDLYQHDKVSKFSFNLMRMIGCDQRPHPHPVFSRIIKTYVSKSVVFFHHPFTL